MTITDRTKATARAQHALAHLEQHPDTRRNQLGAVRDQLNIVRNMTDQAAVDDAVYALECLVLTVYRGRPDCPDCQ